MIGLSFSPHGCEVTARGRDAVRPSDRIDTLSPDPLEAVTTMADADERRRVIERVRERVTPDAAEREAMRAAVSTLTDRIGSTDLTGNATYKAGQQNGEAVYQHDGLDDGHEGSLSLSQPLTITAVVTDAAQVRGNAAAAREMIVTNDVSDGSGGEIAIYWEGNSIHSWKMRANKPGDNFNNFYGTDADAPILLTAILDGANSALREDGTQQATGDAGSISWGGDLTTGLRNSGNNTFLNGAFGEIVIYDGNLDATGDLADEEQRLSDKWGLGI